MNNTDWQKVRETFETFIELDSSQQTEYLTGIETNNQELYTELISLLSADQLEDLIPESRSIFGLSTKKLPKNPETNMSDLNDSTRDDILIGETIGNRYEIIKKLGSGGMGDVFLATDRNLMNRETVVKMLKSETNPEFARKFKHEIEALARLKDPGIVTILDSGTHGSQQFLVIEYVEGEDLQTIISPIFFSRNDFPSPLSLAARFASRETNLDRYFFQRFSPKTQQTISQPPNKKQTAIILRDEFDRLLAVSDLYNSEIFSDAGIIFSPDVIGPFDDKSKLMEFNRSIIEAAFPNDIARGKDKRLTAIQAGELFRQLGISLTHGHKKGIIHRDLKPANIMVTQNEQNEWQTKLIDFGVAKVQESLAAPTTAIGLSFGTRKYMSPEQINGDANLTFTTDIYALGLVAFEALTGQDVFPTDSFIERCRMQNDEEFSEITKFRQDLSPEVMEVIGQALSFDPKQRPATAEEFGNQLAETLLKDSSEPAMTVASFKIPDTINETATEVMPPIQHAESLEIPKLPSEIVNLDQSLPPRNSTKTISVIAGVITILILLGTGIGGIVWWNMTGSESANEVTNNTTAGEDQVKRELNYKLIVTKYFNGKPFQDPFEATGDEIFGDGWRFKMVMESPQSGNLYLLAESQQTKDLVMLYPHPDQNDGKSMIEAKKEVETSQMQFDKDQGTEKFWIVWSKDPVSELEAVKSYVNPKDRGIIKEKEKEMAVRDFLTKAADAGKLTEKDSDNKKSKRISSTVEVLVKLAEFRHN